MVQEREEIDDEYKWNLEEMFPSEEAWKETFEEASQEVEKFEQYKGRVTESGETLLEVIKLREEVKRKIKDLSSYAQMRYDQDTRNQEYQALKSKASTLSSEFSSAVSFIEPEIQDAGEERIKELIDEEEGLEIYRHYFDDVLRFRPHTLSKDEEKLVSSLGDVLDAPDDAYKMLMNADMTFPEVETPEGEEVEITQSNFTKFLKNEDREFRKEVYEKFYDEIDTVSNTVTSTFQKNVKRNVKMADIRSYDSAREASLFNSNIPVDVYDNLVDSVEANLDALHKHLELKESVLEVDQLGMQDVYMPVATSEEPEIDFEEAKEYVLKAVEPLGEEYQEAMREGLESGWVDVYENRGKRAGAYSGGTYDSMPYILLNYQDDVNSMYTLAHELGHSMHSHFSTGNQPYVYGGYKIFVAEVASTVNEALLTRYLMENAPEKIRKHALSHYLENFRNTLFRQTMFADFEQKVHEEIEDGEALTSGKLNDMYRGLKEDYYRPAEIDERIEREWMRIPHFYYNFYVFQYATGISAAETLVEKIKEEGPEDYIEFLKTGSSKYPLEALKVAGIDMEDPEAVEKAIKHYREHVEKGEKMFN